MEDVPGPDPFGPLSLEVECIRGDQHPRLGDDAGMGLAADIEKLAGLFVGVVFQPLGPDLLVLFEVVKVDVPAGAYIARLFVVIHLVGAKQHDRAFDLGGHPWGTPQSA